MTRAEVLADAKRQILEHITKHRVRELVKMLVDGVPPEQIAPALTAMDDELVECVRDALKQIEAALEKAEREAW